jgi:hypothetical protein
LPFFVPFAIFAVKKELNRKGRQGTQRKNTWTSRTLLFAFLRALRDLRGKKRIKNRKGRQGTQRRNTYTSRAILFAFLRALGDLRGKKRIKPRRTQRNAKRKYMDFLGDTLCLSSLPLYSSR